MISYYFHFLIGHENNTSKSVAPKVGRAVTLYESQAFEENSQEDDEVDLVFEKPKRQKTKTTETGTLAVAAPTALVPAEHQEDLTQMVSTIQDL